MAKRRKEAADIFFPLPLSLCLRLSGGDAHCGGRPITRLGVPCVLPLATSRAPRRWLQTTVYLIFASRSSYERYQT
jgi:hypothetical protein